MFPVMANLQEDELLGSWLSRLARLNGIAGVADLLKDFDISPAACHAGQKDELDRLALVFAIDPAVVSQRSFQRREGERTQIGGHVMADGAMSRGQLRVCPACLRDDIGTTLDGATAFRIYGRLFWALQSARCCPKHHLLLVGPPEPGPNHEFHLSWEPWLLDIFDGDLDRQVASEGRFETFVARSLAGETPARSSLLATLPLHVVGVAAEVVGLTHSYGVKWSRNSASEEEMATATDAGFDLLQKGEGAVRALLDRLRLAPRQPQQRPNGRYGQLYDWLRRGAGSGSDFRFLQDVLGQHILENWAASETELAHEGLPGPRRFHSALTAAAQFGMRPKQVQNLLRDAGLVGGLELPEFEQLYDAATVEDILSAEAGAISMADAMPILGLTRTQTASMIEAGLLTVSIGGDRARPRFSAADLSAFMGRHGIYPVHPDIPMERDRIGLATAARRKGVSTPTIYRLALEGRLAHVQRAKDDLLWSSLRILMPEVDSALANEVYGGSPRTNISTASEQLGISSDFLRELSAHGWFQFETEQNPRTHQPITTLANADIEAFKHRFISLRLLSRRLWRQVRAVRQKMDQAGHEPAIRFSKGAEAIYDLRACYKVFADREGELG